eukprot:3918116-Rhodomonas_salina.1
MAVLDLAASQDAHPIPSTPIPEPYRAASPSDPPTSQNPSPTYPGPLLYCRTAHVGSLCVFV